MKQMIFTCLLLVALCSCGSSQYKEAQGQVRKTQDALRPGTIATSATGYRMKATLNGKIWTASSMVSPEAAGRIVGYSGKDYIGLPYSKTDMVIGNKIMLGEDNAPDLAINNGCLWKDVKGEMVITAVSNSSAEGNFFFTLSCSSTNEIMKVTDGTFRIMLTAK